MEEESREAKLLRQVLKRLDVMDNRLSHLEGKQSKQTSMTDYFQQQNAFETYFLNEFPQIKLIYRPGESDLNERVADQLAKLLTKTLGYYYVKHTRKYDLVLIFRDKRDIRGVTVPSNEEMRGTPILIFFFRPGMMPTLGTAARREDYLQFKHVFFFLLEKDSDNLNVNTEANQEYRNLVDVLKQ